MKIIIDNQANINDQLAVIYVSKVIKGGRVSEANNIKHYCWVTKFESGMTVVVRKKRTEKSADSFVVYKS